MAKKKTAPAAAPNTTADLAANPAESRDDAATATATPPAPDAPEVVGDGTGQDAPAGDLPRDDETPPAGEPPAEPELVVCQVISPLRHNGERFKVGDAAYLDPDAFARLHASGVVKVADI